MSDRTQLGNASAAGSPPNPRGGIASMPARGMGTFKVRKGTQPIKAPYELTESGFTDGADVAQKARLYEESVGYPNLAGQPYVVEQAKEAVKGGLNSVFNVMEFLRNKWLILYRLYRGDTLDTFSYGRTRLHSPEPFKAVETTLPKLLRALFADSRTFKFYGLHEEHDNAAKLQEILCRHQLLKSGDRGKQSRFLRDGLIYGTAIQKTWWKQELGEMTYRTAEKIDKGKPTEQKYKLGELKQEELIFDGNWSENVSIFDFLSSPSASSIEDAEWCADRSGWPDFKVKAMGELGHWKNLEKLKDHPGSADTSFGDEFKERKAYAYGVFDPRQASWAPQTPHYEVIDWWGNLVIANDRGEYKTRLCNVVMIDPDGLQIIARVTECPFWHKQKPYQVWRPISLEDELYGIGLLEMIARLSMEKDMKRNLLMSAAQLESNPMWLISDDANIPAGQLLLRPGLGIRVPDIEKSIAPLHVPQVSDSALKAENVLTVDIRETTGATSPSMGAKDPFGSDKTATQHMSEIDEANLRLYPMLESYEQEVQVPRLNQMVWNNQQFMSYAQVVRDIGPLGIKFQDRYKIEPHQIIGRFLVQPLASHRLATKMTQVQQLVNILDRIPVLAQLYGPHTFNAPRILAKILEQGFDMRDVDELIKLPDAMNLLTPTQEHMLWYHGNVPPRKPDDNDLRHVIAHKEELSTPQFAELEKASPQCAAKARAHIADHMQAVEVKFMQQEDMLQQFAQLGSQQAAVGGGGGGSPLAGAAGPNQEPGSPKVRRNENERGEGASEAKSNGSARESNAGAQ